MTLTIKLDKSAISFYRVLVFLYFFLTVVMTLFNNSNTVTRLRLFVLLIAAIIGYFISIKKKLNYPIYLALFFSICWFFCWIFQDSVNLSITLFCYTLLYIGFSVLLLEGYFGIWESGLLFLFCAVVVVYWYLRGVDPNAMLTSSSRNFISVLLLFTLLLYYLALLKSKNEKNLIWFLPAIIFFGISILAYGRGGILTSGFLLCCLIVYKSLYTDKLRAKRGLRILVLLIIAFIVVYVATNINIAQYLGKFSVSVVDESRLKIWSSFFRNNMVSVRDFIFGSNASLIREDRNLHNSFLQCYASYSVVAFCVLIVLIVRSFICGIKSKEYLWTILLATLMLRAFTDRLFFQGYCEVFLYYFIMYHKHNAIANRKI